MSSEASIANSRHLFKLNNNDEGVKNIHKYVTWAKGNIYKSFISSMDKMKSDEIINDWKAISYDWRLSLEDLLNSGKEYSGNKIFYAGELGSTSDPYIISELRRLASSSATGEVVIIAHSNGGLLTKALTNKLGNDASNSSTK